MVQQVRPKRLMTWQEKVAEEFNKSFNEPFMPDGFCKASVEDGILRINLGDRDVAFDRGGNPIGSGSNVGDAVQWHIEKIPSNL